MGAFGQELPQPLGRLRDGVGPCDADGVETEVARGFDECRPQLCRIAQKSRSA
jgi:hypothetical protein